MEKALKENKYNLDIFAIFYESLQTKAPAKRIEAIKQFYTEDKRDISFIVQALEVCKIDEVYFSYAEKMRDWGLISVEHIERKKMLLNAQYVDVYQNVLQTIGVKLQMFFVLLLCANNDKLMQDNMDKLPEDLQKIMVAYSNKCTIDGSGYALYKNLLPRVLEYGTATVIVNYLALAENITDEKRLEIVEILHQNMHYQAALEQLNKIESKYTFVLEGILRFYLNDNAGAKFCLQKAIENDEEANERLEYLQWICKGDEDR